MACEVESKVEYINFVIREYFVYKDVWENYIEVGEMCCDVIVTYTTTAIL